MHLYRNIGRFAPSKIPTERGYSQELIALSQCMMQNLKKPKHRPAPIDAIDI